MTIKGEVIQLNKDAATPQFTVKYFDDEAPEETKEKMVRSYARTGLSDDMIMDIIKEECNSLTGSKGSSSIITKVGDIFDPVSIQAAQDAKTAEAVEAAKAEAAKVVE